MNFATWQAATQNAGRSQPGTVALWQWISATYPGLYRNGGIYVYRPVRGSTSLSIHAEGRALDAMIAPVAGKGDPRGHELVQRLGGRGKQLGIQAIIFDRKIWTAKSPAGRAYTGVHPHYDHLHIEQDRVASRTLTIDDYRRVLGGEMPQRILRLTSPYMRGEDVAALQRALRIAADGVFGPLTDRAVKHFQAENGLRIDGIVGPRTLAMLGL